MSLLFDRILFMKCETNYIELEKLNLFYYCYNKEEKTFYKKANKSDFYISKELLTLSNLLEEKKINYLVDKNSNIIIK